ncbi:MAG: hypothetical protein U0Z26_14555 [Anaerolineales bacterium]
MKVYSTRVAYRDSYELHATPIPQDVVKDICVELEIEKTNKLCQPNVVVHSPDFFYTLKLYFSGLPEESRTLETVQDKLGRYLLYCEDPYPDGGYVCSYDFVGDRQYPFYFHFNKENIYDEVIARAGGS